MGQNKDKKKRKRRKMTPAEHAERHNTPMIANAFRRVSASATANTAASASVSDNVNAAPSNEGTPESLATGVSASANSAIASMTNSANATAAAGSHDESKDELMSNLNATTIRDEGFSLQAVGILNPSPVVPSIDDDDDGVDFDDDEAEDDKERGRKRVRRKRTDFMWKYMTVLQKRLRKELNEAGEKSNQVGALSSKWLIEFLEMHFYIVPMHCAPYICKKLGMGEKDIGLPAYYCDMKVWLPEK